MPRVRINALFSKQKIDAYIQKEVKKWERAVLQRLKVIGETFVSNARQMGTYKDQSGNLRGSINYIIYYKGKRVADDLDSGNGGPGAEKARALIRKLKNEVVPQYAQGFCLICVAGMEYALYVEAKGLDVITGSSLIAQTQLRAVVTEIKKAA